MSGECASGKSSNPLALGKKRKQGDDCVTVWAEKISALFLSSARPIFFFGCATGELRGQARKLLADTKASNCNGVYGVRIYYAITILSSSQECKEKQSHYTFVTYEATKSLSLAQFRMNIKILIEGWIGWLG